MWRWSRTPGGTVTEVVWTATKICPLTAKNGCPVTASVATHRDNQGVIDITRTATHRHFADAVSRGFGCALGTVGATIDGLHVQLIAGTRPGTDIAVVILIVVVVVVVVVLEGSFPTAEKLD